MVFSKLAASQLRVLAVDGLDEAQKGFDLCGAENLCRSRLF